jgi:hypothetical protein
VVLEERERAGLVLAQTRAWCLDGYARTLRIANGLSLTDVADAAQAHFTSVWRWENAGRRGGRLPGRTGPGLRYGRFLAHLAAGDWR